MKTTKKTTIEVQLRTAHDFSRASANTTVSAICRTAVRTALHQSFGDAI